MYFSSYDIFLLPALILSIWAQWSVNSAYKKYSGITNIRGITGAEAAKRILGNAGIGNVSVNHIGGNLTDNFNPVNKTLNLSDGVYGSSTIAAVGIAAHEAGHAIQHNRGYIAIKLRNLILPVAQLSSSAAMPLFVLGLVLSMGPLVDLGIILFSAAVLFQVITLPVEFNASHRAIRMIQGCDLLSDEEIKGAKKVLKAAAMTYVASAAMAALQLLRLLAISGRRRD